MPKLITTVKVLCGKTVSTAAGPIRFDADGVADATDEQFALLKGIDGYLDPNAPPADPGEAPAQAERPTMGQTPDDFVLDYIRYSRDKDRLLAINVALVARMEALGIVPIVPIAEAEADAPEPAADSSDDAETEDSLGLDGNVATVAALIATLDSVTELDLYEEAERASAGRKGVLRAIADRRAQLAGTDECAEE